MEPEKKRGKRENMTNKGIKKCAQPDPKQTSRGTLMEACLIQLSKKEKKLSL